MKAKRQQELNKKFIFIKKIYLYLQSKMKKIELHSELESKLYSELNSELDSKLNKKLVLPR
jgi:hypothetical protein